MAIRDVQSEIIAEVIARLAAVPSFGACVLEDSVVRLLDAEDADLPDDFIVVQEGSASELDRVGLNAREQLALYVVPMTRQRHFASPLRAARLALKAELKGHKGGLKTAGVISLSFDSEEMRAPGAGRRLAGRSLLLKITYSQSYQE